MTLLIETAQWILPLFVAIVGLGQLILNPNLDKIGKGFGLLLVIGMVWFAIVMTNGAAEYSKVLAANAQKGVDLCAERNGFLKHEKIGGGFLSTSTYRTYCIANGEKIEMIQNDANWVFIKGEN